MKYKTWVRRTFLKIYRNLFGLRRFLLADYWRLKLYLSPKGSNDAPKPRSQSQDDQAARRGT